VRTCIRIAVVLALLTAAATTLAPARADPNVDEAQFVAAINAVRARNSLPPVSPEGQLISVARAWSSHMAGSGTLAHNPSLAGQVSDWKTLGENVGTGSTVASIEAAFEASPHHYENMVDPSFQYVGVGVVEVNGTIWVTEDYKQSRSGLPTATAPKAAPPPSKPAPAPRAPAPRAAPTAAQPIAAAHPATPAAASAPAATTPPPEPPPVVTPAPPPPPSVLGTGVKSPSRIQRIVSSRFLDSTRVAALAVFAAFGAGAFVARKRGMVAGPA
jgi:uncharacterized protein YkwD